MSAFKLGLFDLLLALLGPLNEVSYGGDSSCAPPTFVTSNTLMELDLCYLNDSSLFAYLAEV
jgi:hypothetical protein